MRAQLFSAAVASVPVASSCCCCCRCYQCLLVVAPHGRLREWKQAWQGLLRLIATIHMPRPSLLPVQPVQPSGRRHSARDPSQEPSSAQSHPSLALLLLPSSPPPSGNHLPTSHHPRLSPVALVTTLQCPVLLWVTPSRLPPPPSLWQAMQHQPHAARAALCGQSAAAHLLWGSPTLCYHPWRWHQPWSAPTHWGSCLHCVWC